MENENLKFNIVYAAAIGTITAVIFITIITIAADLYLPLKNWLADTFYHHWIAKGVLSIIIFLIAGFLLWILPIRADEEKIGRLLKILSWLLIVGALAIFLFFVYETIK
jgi:hypothetical protein